MKESINIYLVCGFVGTGKTTYINQLLKTLKGTVAVIQNEMGEVELAFDGESEETVMGGCVCCTLAGELVCVLQKYVAEEPMDNIVIEMPSLAKLSAVRHICEKLEETVETRFVYASVNLVDGYRFHSHLRNFGTFFPDQLANADTIILTRTDKLSESKREALDKKLAEMAPQARIVEG